jgi:tetratricopeptide (TPR) repeat protein
VIIERTHCPDAETLAAFADGKLPRQERAAVLAHVADCEDCSAAVGAIAEVHRESQPATAARRGWWLAAAAVLVLGFIGITFWRNRPASGLDEVIALMPATSRPADARLSGAFGWAPYRGAMRASEGEDDSRRMRLIGAAGEVVDRAARDASADAQQDAGIALVVADQPLQAIERLRAAVQKDPDDAGAWSDLAAAQSAAALRHGRQSLLPEALASADRALRIDPRLAVALFNRAVILERLGLPREARKAWDAYLAVDSTSPWAEEARRRRDSAQPSAAIDRRRTRAYAEVEHLAEWGAAVLANDGATAQQALATARSIGEELRTKSEDLLIDAVRAIETTTSRAQLAEAHLTYRRGRMAYSRQRLGEAEVDLTRAAAGFAAARSPLALMARYYAANVRFDRNDVAGARAALEPLLTEALAHPRYTTLTAMVRWELALCLMVDGDWSGALPLLRDSRAAFEQLGERSHHGFVESLLADTLTSLGRPDEAWAARSRAFLALSTDGRGERLPNSLKSAAQMELRSGRPETARALLALEGAAARTLDDRMVATDSLIRATLVNTALGDRDAAGRALRDASAAAATIVDPSLAALARSHLQLATAATLLASDPDAARQTLTAAIESYEANKRAVFLPECYLLRARAALQRGDRNAAMTDLERGIALLERAPVREGAVVGTGVLDAGVALFDEAIRLSLDAGKVDEAFRYIERSRTQLGERRAGTADLQKRLAGTAAAVLQIASLPNELIAICVTANGVEIARHPMRREQLETLSRETLYDLLIRPFALAQARQLIVVADPRLEQVPFAALYDKASRRYLIEKLPVSMAMSASALETSSNVARSPLLAVGLPTGDAAALPESARELAAIAALHGSAETLDPQQASFDAFVGAAQRAGVIHLAGHTQRQPGDGSPALPFANGRIAAGTIARQRLEGAPVVVLAACETLRRPQSANIRALTLGAGFLAAGASDVVGTLAPIADGDAREVFEAVHRRLARGESAGEAVRGAQLEALGRRDPSWHIVAALTRRIAG